MSSSKVTAIRKTATVNTSVTEAGEAPSTPATVLVVDDHPLNRKYLTALLRHAGHRVLEAADGLAALARARSSRPSLVISDILMPGMDGLELVQQLRADSELAETPVIFYTATYCAAEARQLANAGKVSIVLPKPSSPQDVVEAVDRCLGRSPAPAPLPRRDAPDLAPLNRLSERFDEHVNEL